MNTPIRRLAVACLVLFVALMGNATYVQYVQAGDLNAKSNNKRVIDDEYARERGAILVGGEPVAESVPSDDQFEFLRTYPNGPLYAHLTGFFSYTYGRSAIEDTENPLLSGSDNRLFVNRVVDLIANKQPKGGSVELTIDGAGQQTAAAALAALPPGTKGSVVALDPTTGAVLTMVSQPSYDPNALASHDFPAVNQAWQTLNDDPANPLLNRATQEIQPPGSTFKLVTASAALETLDLNPGSVVQGGSELAFPGIEYTLPNSGGGNCGGDQITLERALNVSCNVSFGSLATQIGQGALDEQAAKFGFGDRVIESIASNASRFTTEGTELELPQLAQTGIGQYEVAATPLQMAMVAAGIANDGVVMQPYVVQTVRDPSLRVLDDAGDGEEYSTALTPDHATMMQQMMISTVQSGTASSARINGVEVGGKTGTAQRGNGLPNLAWFASFATSGDQQVAVAVMVESAEATDDISGGRLAGPIARSVMEALLAP
ncbi:penicillin-binding protein 2 [Aeromicrobium sp. Leaf350]|uniref:peptidoglycan D,D-transpeptidase FtsI family protein n=1 Tax=Aeromicrobium sp. Leaf350 TaxID=2876565 RepID=UPI001E52E52D|nr:penicillin-binding protein 2 [Aeromicrobium sp. Leaf350]